MNSLPPLSQVHTMAEINGADILQNDLMLCLAYAELVKAKLSVGEGRAAARILAEAETGCATISWFLPHVSNPEQKGLIKRQLTGLRMTLEALRAELRSSKL